MPDTTDTLFLITARGGSKGLPGKNILPLAGKPMICYTIDAARGVTKDENICVSSDDLEIIKVVENYGLKVPFIRPGELATDTAGSREVILHAINFFNENSGKAYKKVCLLQPTSPHRNTEDIVSAFDLLAKKRAKAIVSVCESDHHPYWMNMLPDDLSLESFEKPEYSNIGRQKLPVYYRINGAIYLSDIEYYKENHSFIGKNSYAFIMNKMHSIDIDDLLDFTFSEFILKSNINNLNL
jgi:CMP-N,N'-diacetyllegionaminic acid synthase